MDLWKKMDWAPTTKKQLGPPKIEALQNIWNFTNP